MKIYSLLILGVSSILPAYDLYASGDIPVPSTIRCDSVGTKTFSSNGRLIDSTSGTTMSIILRHSMSEKHRMIPGIMSHKFIGNRAYTGNDKLLKELYGSENITAETSSSNGAFVSSALLLSIKSPDFDSTTHIAIDFETGKAIQAIVMVVDNQIAMMQSEYHCVAN